MLWKGVKWFLFGSFFFQSMSEQDAAAPITGTVEKTKLERGSEDYNLFHNLIQTVPGFLGLTASVVKQRFPQFKDYSTPTINSSLQNAKRACKRREAASKREKDKEKKENSTEQNDTEKSKFVKCVNCLK